MGINILAQSNLVSEWGISDLAWNGMPTEGGGFGEEGIHLPAPPEAPCPPPKASSHPRGSLHKGAWVGPLAMNPLALVSLSQFISCGCPQAVSTGSGGHTDIPREPRLV